MHSSYILLSKIIGTWWINRYPGVVSFIMDYKVVGLTGCVDRPAMCTFLSRLSLPVFVPHIKPQTFRIVFILVCAILHLRFALPNGVRLRQIPSSCSCQVSNCGQNPIEYRRDGVVLSGR